MADSPNASVLARLLLVEDLAARQPDLESVLQCAARGLEALPGVAGVRSWDPVDPAAQGFEIRHQGACHGVLGLELADPTAFAPYEPHVRHLARMLGVLLDGRALREEHERCRTGLEALVRARTRENEELLRSRDLLARSSDELFIIDPATRRFLDANETTCALLGYPRDELLKLRIEDVDPCFRPSEWPWHVDIARTSPEGLKIDTWHRRRDGVRIPVEVRARHVVLDGVEYMVASARDITERKKAEASLRASEERFRLAMDATDDGIWDWNVATGEAYFSPSYTRMLGYSPREFTERADTWADLILPEDRERVFAANEACIRGEAPSFEVEYRMVARDGTLRWILGRGKAVVRGADGRATRMLGTHIDITGRRQAEAEQARLQAQLHQARKMESLGSLAGGVAHDMNNVLGAILGLASASLEALPAEAPPRAAFATIVKAAERGGKVVQAMLSFARQSPAEARELDLNQLLREEFHLLEHTTLARIRLELDLAADLRPVLGDSSALSHAFMNLCVNAVDAMPEHGTLALRSRNLDGGQVEIQVEDNGSGMPREVLDQALDPFFTTKMPGKGTGLGLSLVYSTVNAHHGQLEIQSEPGRGTRVRMRFPAAARAAAPAGPVEEPGAGTDRRNLRVLLVDDDELVQNAMRAMLDAMGHPATVCSSGEEALARLADGLRPDMVILDLNMPGLGGAETLPRIRALMPAVPVLIATGRADQAALDLVGQHPGVALLSKPYSMRELQQQFGRLCR